MLYYEPRLRLMPATLHVYCDQLVWYRNAAWMLNALTDSADERRAIRAGSLEPSLFRSRLYERLLQGMAAFFGEVFDSPAGEWTKEVPEFVFRSFHAAEDRA